MPREIGPRNAHDKTEVDGETITCSQYSSTKCITTCATVTALEAGECRACDSTSCYFYRAKKAFVRTLVFRHACGTSFWLCIVVMAGTVFHGRDHWQYRIDTKTFGQPDNHAYAPTSGIGWYRFSGIAQVIGPDTCMTLLSLSHAFIEFCQVWISFCFRERLVEFGTFLFSEIVCAITLDGTLGCHVYYSFLLQTMWHLSQRCHRTVRYYHNQYTE